MTKKEKQNLFNKVFSDQYITKDNYPVSMYKWGIDVLDNYETKYHVDLDIQRNRYFKRHHMLGYLQSRFNGSAMNPYIMVHIDSVRQNVENNIVDCLKHSEDYVYYSKLWEMYKEWLSIDGNNRTGGDLEYWTDKLIIPKGFSVPLLEGERKHYVTTEKDMNRSGILNEYGDEYLNWEKSPHSNMDIKRILWSSKANLHLIFRTVNQIKELNAQEDRNCINSEIAKTVRVFSNGSIGNTDDWLIKQFSQSEADTRNHEEFTAWTYSYIKNHGEYFGRSEIFGHKGSNLSDKIVTKHYEKDTIDDKTIKEANKAILKLKQYIDYINAGPEWISSNFSLSKTLVNWFHSLMIKYVDIDWDSVFRFIDDFHSEGLKDDKTIYKFPSLSAHRSYSDVLKAGHTVVGVIYSFYSSQELKMVLNGFMNYNLKRTSSTSSSITREMLYKQQGGKTPDGKRIEDWNDTNKYHVDHIIPISKFTLADILANKDPNDISNLQLVEKQYNLAKGKKIKKSS